MKQQIKRMSPHQNGKVFGILMALSSLIILIPMFVIFSMIHMPLDQNGHRMGPPAFMFLILPILYLVVGYIMTVIWCAVYNLVSKYVGGIEFELGDDSE